MTYDEFLSAAVALAVANGYDPRKGSADVGSIPAINRAIETLLGPIEDKDSLRMAVRSAAGQLLGRRMAAWTERGRKAYEEITDGST